MYRLILTMGLALVALDAGAHARETHQNITRVAVEYLAKVDTGTKCISGLNDQLQVGTYHEDDGVRPAFHFTPALTEYESTCSSLQWGFETAACSTTGFGRTETLTNTHTWANAIARAMDAKGKSSPEGLRELGYVLHLLQDLTSPAHTRDDAHLTFAPGESDPVEAETRTPTAPATSEGLVSLATPEAFLSELAKSTSENFYSKDTVFTGKGPESARDDSDYFYDSDDRRIAYKGAHYKTRALFGAATPQDATIDEEIAEDQFDELGPIAVRYTASLIKHYLEATQMTAEGCFIDFEQFNGPSIFTGVAPPLTSEGATFSGGQILRGTTFLPRNASTVYGTAFFCPGCTPSLSIDLSTPVDGISMLVMNGQTFNVSYVITDDIGASKTVNLPPNSASGSALVSLSSPGISKVTITSNASAWDFFVDNITLGLGSAQTELKLAPSSLQMRSSAASSSSPGDQPAGSKP